MATITQRKLISGELRWKISLRKRGMRSFYITFDDHNEACDWIEENEMKFYENPDKYFKWRERIYHKMNREQIPSYQNIIRPKKWLRQL